MIEENFENLGITNFMKDIKEKAEKYPEVSFGNVYLQKDFAKYNTSLTIFQKRILFFAISKIGRLYKNISPAELANKNIFISIKEFLKVYPYKTNVKGNYGSIYERVEEELEKMQKSIVFYKDYANNIQKISWFQKTVYYSKKGIAEINKENKKTRQQILENLTLEYEQYKELFENPFNQSTEISFEEFAKQKFIERDIEMLYPIFDEEEVLYTIQFSKPVAQLLTDFKEQLYIRYNYLISHSLKSKHSIRIYELLQTRKDTNLIYIKYEELRGVLDLKPEEYKTKSDFNKLLKRVGEELNTKFELGFNFKIDTGVVTLMAKKNDEDLMYEIFGARRIEELELEEKEFTMEYKKKKKENNKPLPHSPENYI